MEPAWKPIADLADALDRFGRASTVDHADDQRTGVAEVAGHVAHVAGQYDEPVTQVSVRPPPPAVARAMALALFSEPHSRRTLAIASTASESLVVRADGRLAEVLGMDIAQLETLRNEVDRHVADVLTRIRAMHWLWGRAGNPRTDPSVLHRLLFPGDTTLTPTRYLRHGCRLYAVVRMKRPPPVEALYMPWLPRNDTWSAAPDGHFSSRHLDDGLLRQCGRAIGRNLDETREILDQVVVVVPEEEAKRFLARDRWRAEGWADVTGLGGSAPGTRWCAEPAPANSFAVDTWMERTPEGGVAVKGARRAFDREARRRVDAVMRSLYAELCARQLAAHGVVPSGQPVLFDLAPYIQRVLTPLLHWTARPDAQRHVAQTIGLDEGTARAALTKLRETWSSQVQQSWTGAPSAERPVTIQGILLAHLARTQASLASIRRFESDLRADHHRMLLLFFAHYVSQAPIGRLWRPVDGALPPPEDIPGQWFWPTWRAVLDAAVSRDDLTDEQGRDV